MNTIDKAATVNQLLSMTGLQHYLDLEGSPRLPSIDLTRCGLTVVTVGSGTCCQTCH